MKRKIITFGSFILLVLSVFLPWFTFNAKMMGYCWGFQFLKWLAVPLVVITVYLFQEKSKMYAVLCEVSLIAIAAAYVVAFGRWQEVCNIAPGFQWNEGLYTATAGYWVSVLLFMVFSAVIQFSIWKRNKSDE